MAKTLLINPSYLRTYGSNQAGIANPVYPVLSLATLAGAARAAGHEVEILDLSYRPYDPVFLREHISTFKPDVVGITATTPLANQMRDMSFLVKDISSKIVTVAGGAHPSALPRETMIESALDAVAFGEADQTFVDILNGVHFSEIKGLYWRNHEEIVANPARPLIEYLDDLAMPAWDLYPIDVYRSKITKIIARYSPLSTVEFSRGCLFKCDFCGSKQTMGLGYRKKSPERCAEELDHIYALGFREVILTDDIFTSDNQWAIQVCEELIKRGSKVAWTCTNGIRVDSANSELFSAMKRAGCYRVHFGFETGNDAVLKAFGKGGKASLKEGYRAVREARKSGLETWGMFMVGLSADTEESMGDTIQFAKEAEVDIKKFGVTTPFPGTPMFNDLRLKGKIRSFNWDDYNVYNEINPIYDHPTLSWDTIQKYYKKAYWEAYYKNPGYIARRVWRGIKTLEFFWDIYFGVRFLILLMTRPKVDEKETYEFRNRWEPLSVPPQQLNSYEYQTSKQNRWRKRQPAMQAAAVSTTAQLS